jgi:hypothetical protein
MQTATGNDFFS